MKLSRQTVKQIMANISVEPVMFLYMFTNFLYFPVLQSLIFDKVCLTDYNAEFCSKLKNNSHSTHYHYVNSQTSHWILMTSVAITIPSGVAVLLFYGALGDRIGRKVPVILPCFGVLAAYLSVMVNAHFMSASLYYILIGPIINGLSGGYIACIMAVYSYVGHITSVESKMMRLSIVESTIFLAGTIGVFISGVILDSIGYQFTFLVLISCISVALIYSIVFLENVHTNDQAQKSGQSCLTMINSFVKESFQCVGKRRQVRVFSTLLIQVICMDILMLCTAGDMDVSFLYLRERLSYDQTLYGYYKGLDNFLRGITLIIIPHLIKKFFNVNDFSLVLVGLASYVANFIVLGIASSKWMAFLAAIVGMFKGFPSAGLRSRMSSLVSQNEQGRLFGLIAASESFTSLIASVLFNSLFPKTYHIYPGFVYMMGVGLLLVAFVLVFYVMKTHPDHETTADNRYDNLHDEADNVIGSEDDVICVQI